MHLTTLLPTLLAITSPAVLARSTTETRDTRQTNDYYVCDYRVFGATGCFEKNQGVGTLTASDLDKCYPFYDLNIKAVNLTNIIDGCSCMFYPLPRGFVREETKFNECVIIVHVYTQSDCEGESLALQKGQKCGGNVLEESHIWTTYKATCP